MGLLLEGLESVGEGSVGGQTELTLRAVQVHSTFMNQPARIHEDDRPSGSCLVHPGLDHREPDEATDPDSGGAGTHEHHPRLGERAIRGAQAGQDPGQHYGRGALDVVVE